jgi:transposase
MKRFVQGQERSQGTLFPTCLDEYVSDDNPVRVIDVFVEELDLRALGFERVIPQGTARPAYHPAALLKIYIYGYLNRIPSSRRLEQETGRNLELMWLTGQLQPDYKTIARFRKDNGPAIRAVCRHFVGLCRKLNLFSQAVVAVDGSKFKAVNTRDKNFTPTKLAKRIEQVEASIAHYLSALDTADRQESELAHEKAGWLGSGAVVGDGPAGAGCHGYAGPGGFGGPRLLQGRGYPGLREGWDHALCVQDPHFERQG